MTITMSSAHSPTSPSLHLRQNSFSNPSVALPTSRIILQPFRCFIYVTVHSPNLLSLLLCHKLFTYFTWRAAHEFRQKPPEIPVLTCRGTWLSAAAQEVDHFQDIKDIIYSGRKFCVYN